MKADTVVAIIAAIFASGGFWAFITAVVQKKNDKKDAKSRMILGLGHHQIKVLCEKYINQKWISSDDYEDLVKYLYEPYLKMGGNGTVKKLMSEVEKLPIRRENQSKGYY